MKKLLSIGCALASLSLAAETFVLKQAPSSLADWTDGAFYDGKAPSGAATDVIQISPGVEVTVSNTQADVVAFLNGIANISLRGNNTKDAAQSKLTLYVADGDTWEYASKISEYSYGNSYSMVEKRGKGALKLLNLEEHAYHSFWHVVEGELWLAPPDKSTAANKAKYASQVWIEKDGVVRCDEVVSFVSTANGKTYTTTWYPTGLYNAGLVTNAGATSAKIYVRGSARDEPDCPCDGKFSGVYLNPQSGAVLKLLGTVNDFTDYVFVYGGTAGLPATVVAAKLGKKGGSDPSSLGLSDYLHIEYGGGGRIVYAGTGETCNKSLRFIAGSATGAPAISEINGGEHGGLKLTGEFTRWSTSTTWIPHIVFGGDNEVPCVFQGTETDFAFTNTKDSPYYGNLYPRYHLKTGTGEWYFPQNPNNTAAGTYQVANGTLAFDKIGPRGECNSLGSSTNCYVWEAVQPDESLRAKYAFLLGSTNLAETGIMEARSAESQICADRPFGVIGKGGFRANCGKVTYANVFGVGAGEKTLVLDGTNACENVVRDVSDGEDGGTVSVLKRGSGTWTLGGDQTFTGGITVEGGTLIVGTSKAFKYYRLLIKEIMDNRPDLLQIRKNKKDSISLESQNSSPTFDEIGLWAKDNSRQNMNLKYKVAWGVNLLPGEFGFGDGILYNNSTAAGYRDLMFDGCRYTSENWLPGGKQWGSSVVSAPFYRNKTRMNSPRLDDESTWIPVDMCLREGAQPIDHFDISNHADDLNNTTVARGAPTACQLLGSTDGLVWEEISETCRVEHAKDVRYAWVSDGCYVGSGGGLIDSGMPPYENPESDSRFNHAGGWKTTKTESTRTFTVLPNLNGAVSVAAGAALKFAGAAADAPVIRKLSVDATSGGTIDGFALADDCELDVKNVPAASDFELPVTFTNLPSALSLKDWTVKFNGTTRSRSLTFANGKLSVHANGMMIILR